MPLSVASLHLSCVRLSLRGLTTCAAQLCHESFVCIDSHFFSGPQQLVLWIICWLLCFFIKENILFIIFMCVYVSELVSCNAHRGHKRVLDSLELELAMMLVNYHVGAHVVCPSAVQIVPLSMGDVF